MGCDLVQMPFRGLWSQSGLVTLSVVLMSSSVLTALKYTYCCNSDDVCQGSDLGHDCSLAPPEEIVNVWELEGEAEVTVAPFHSLGLIQCFRDDSERVLPLRKETFQQLH